MNAIRMCNYFAGVVVPSKWGISLDPNKGKMLFLRDKLFYDLRIPESTNYSLESYLYLYFVSFLFSQVKLISFFKIIFTQFIFSRRYFFFNILKAHGINMRFKVISRNLLFLRVGFSHGYFLRIPQGIFFKVYRRRYILVVGCNEELLNNFLYHIRYFRRFFTYKLIGVKFLQDKFKIKIGKKKAF
jgi:hypothetical protein